MIVNPQMPDIGRPARGAARAPASGWLGRLGTLVANAGLFVRGRSRR
jgi:hypothetical protein